MERWLISIPRRMISGMEKLALFYGYYDADYSSEELKERYAAIIAGEESKMKSEKKDDAHEAHPEVQIEEVFQKLF